jgi:hypothetical protein
MRASLRAAMAAATLAAVFFLLALAPGWGEEDSGLDWGGYLLADLGLALGEQAGLADNKLYGWELRLGLRAEARPGPDSRLYAEAWLRNLQFPRLEGPADLASPEAGGPLDLELPEAWFELYGFPGRAVDLRLGRQRIAWGRADQVSIVDNLNPDDLEDPWDFGRHLGSEAVSLTGYLGESALQMVYIPIFRPARLSAAESIGAAALRNLPGRDPAANAVLGARLSTRLAGWDLAAGYIYGRDDFPVAVETAVVSAVPLEVDVTLAWPRLHIASLDLAGELAGLGVWAEAAWFQPQGVEVVDDRTLIGGARAAAPLEGYWKALAGLDYTFPGGLYLSVQAVHGLFFENRREDIDDYLLVGLEWKVFHDRLRLGPVGIAIEVDDWSHPAESWALAFTPQVSLFPADGAELTLGLHWVEGEEGTVFAGRKATREVYLQGRYSF